LFFDPNGKGRVFPTVYTLWAFPNAMKSLLTFSEVSPKVLGGADLMLPGVIVPPAGLSLALPGGVRLVTWNIPAVIN
jgi:translation initiation factor 2D